MPVDSIWSRDTPPPPRPRPRVFPLLLVACGYGAWFAEGVSLRFVIGMQAASTRIMPSDHFQGGGGGASRPLLQLRSE